jgi:hypothetical protein
MIGKYEFNVLTNYIKCSAFSSASKYEEAKLQEIFFIPKLRSRIIVNLESGKRSNEPSSITILADGSFIMSVARYYESELPLFAPIVIPPFENVKEPIVIPPFENPIVIPPKEMLEEFENVKERIVDPLPLTEPLNSVEFYWNGDALYWEDLIDNLAEYTALITNV